MQASNRHLKILQKEVYKKEKLKKENIMAVKKPKDLLLYSTSTELAYRIAKEYYNNIFYVWCTDTFDAALQPGTSNPRTLCSRYLDQI